LFAPTLLLHVAAATVDDLHPSASLRSAAAGSASSAATEQPTGMEIYHAETTTFFVVEREIYTPSISNYNLL
jgi:hypothetical protein